MVLLYFVRVLFFSPSVSSSSPLWSPYWREMVYRCLGSASIYRLFCTTLKLRCWQVFLPSTIHPRFRWVGYAYCRSCATRSKVQVRGPTAVALGVNRRNDSIFRMQGKVSNGRGLASECSRRRPSALQPVRASGNVHGYDILSSY